MRYRPVNKTAEQILLHLGFESANRGYTLKRKIEHQTKGKPVQIHCLILLDGTMDTHEDYLDEKGNHFSKKHNDTALSRLARFKQLFEQIDNDTPIELGKSLKKHYHFKLL